MNTTPEEQLKEIEKKIMLMGRLDIPGIIMIALWAYAKYAANGEPFHPLLNNQIVVNGLLIVGGVILGLCAIQVVKLSLEKSRIKNEHNI